MANATDERVVKLWKQGLSTWTIARRIGRPGETDRVLAALERAGIDPTPTTKEAEQRAQIAADAWFEFHNPAEE